MRSTAAPSISFEKVDLDDYPWGCGKHCAADRHCRRVPWSGRGRRFLLLFGRFIREILRNLLVYVLVDHVRWIFWDKGRPL